MECNTDELKSIEIDIFKTFIRICRENDLQYFVLGGTALGTVRHKGFIPWDDDIDVALPREAYEVFLRIAQNQLPDNMFLQTYVTDRNYPLPFAKIRRTDTAFIEKTVSKIQMNHGVYIDIFPLDGYPKSAFAAKLLKIKEKALRMAISDVFLIEADSGSKKLIRKILGCLLPDYRILVKELDMLYKKYPYGASLTVANFCGAWGEKEVMPKAYFGNGSDGEFEGIQVNLPEKPHEYLSSLYGSYMELPPEEKRVSHHYCTVIDLDKSYKEYTEEG